MVLGLDFDNTIIKYDELFHRVAFEKNLISADFPKEKNTVRNYLREKNIEDEWIIIQGEVYGDRIKEAIPFEGMLERLEKLRIKKIPINIISHKTRVPYLGPKIDLHAAAINWMKINHFFDQYGLNFTPPQIYFEETKEEKIDRIMANGCTHYVDDLPEILEMIPNGIQKILFSPNHSQKFSEKWTVINSWKELPAILS